MEVRPITAEEAQNIVSKLIRYMQLHRSEENDSEEIETTKCASDKFVLKPFKEFFKQNKGLSSLVYHEFHILCHKDKTPLESAGYAICNYVLTDSCPIQHGLKVFDPTKGTSSLRHHVTTHTSSIADVAQVHVSLKSKREVTDAAAEASVRGILPLSFTYRKRGMTKFAKALISFGQKLHPNAIVNDRLVNQLLPAPQKVRESVSNKASVCRNKIKSNINILLERGGGITCDGLKQMVNGKKYYDLVIHFIDCTGDELKAHASVQSLLLFIFLHAGPESADALRHAIDAKLQSLYSISFGELMKHFTFVTDSAANMPRIVGSSVSIALVPTSER